MPAQKGGGQGASLSPSISRQRLASHAGSPSAPSFDRALAALITDLYQRGLDRRVLLVAMGEFGRTPRINRNAGRDHWAPVMSVVFSGGSLRMGQIIGSSTALGDAPKDNPYRPDHVLSMVYRHLGIDSSITFPDFSGRPRYLLEHHDWIHPLI